MCWRSCRIDTANTPSNDWHQFATTHGRATRPIFIHRHTCADNMTTGVTFCGDFTCTKPANVLGFLPEFLITPFSRFRWLALNPVATLCTTRPTITNCTFSTDLRKKTIISLYSIDCFYNRD